MSALKIMKEANLLDWHTLLVGLDHGWCKKLDVIHYAENCLRRTESEINGDLIDIVSGVSLSEADLIALGLHLITELKKPLSSDMKEKALEKWRYAHIFSLLESNHSINEKINLLQEIYGEFGFPEDMLPCSIYSDSKADPLAAAQTVMLHLWQKFNVLVPALESHH